MTTGTHCEAVKRDENLAQRGTQGRMEETMRIRSWRSRHRDWNGADGKCKKGTVALIFILRTSSFVRAFRPRGSFPRRPRWRPARSFRDENFCQGRKPHFFFSVTYREFAYQEAKSVSTSSGTWKEMTDWLWLDSRHCLSSSALLFDAYNLIYI